MKRALWIDRHGQRCAVAVNTKALDEAGIRPDADGVLRIPLDTVGAALHAREAVEMLFGVALAFAYPAPSSPVQANQSDERGDHA